MKAFSFRLEPVVRWREMQLGLQRGSAAAAMGRVSQLQALLDLRTAEGDAGSEQIRREPTGVVLASYARHVETSRARIREAADQLRRPNALLRPRWIVSLTRTRSSRLIEDLRQARHREWRIEHERELAAFADEAFLGRVLRGTIGKRTGA